METPDRIHLRDHVVAADIGAFHSERGRPQRLRFAVEAELSEPVVGAEDHVDRILSYDVLTAAVADGLADRRYDLLETLAERIAAQVLVHPRAARVSVTIEKLDRGPGALGVTLVRAAGRVAVDADAVRPALLVAGAGTPAAAPAGAVIVVPDAPRLPVPQGGDARRIALLALDQAAFALAGQLGLDVAHSRTELDWAAASRRPIVWAPARMAADVPNLPADPAVLALWLAGRIEAAELIFDWPEGRRLPDPPAGFRVPLRRGAG